MNVMFYEQSITDEVFAIMYDKSYKKECKVPRGELRHLVISHYGFDSKEHRGELIVNQLIAKEILIIFQELYKIKYPIEKIRLIDEYDGDDIRSMEDNNTSCFNYRNIEGTNQLSKHSNGLAIDINPLYNPYIKYINGKQICLPKNGKAYQNRLQYSPYKIEKEDRCYQLFQQYGFDWGGNWKDRKDYQHFEKIEPRMQHFE